MAKILLDGGHYKNYNQGKYSKYYEGNMTIKLAKLLKKYLEDNYIVQVDLTHNGINREMGVYKRGIMAKGYSAIYSLHSNATTDNTVNRVVIIAPHDNTKYDNFAKKLGDSIKECMNVSQETQVYRRKTRKGNEYYGLLRGAKDVGVNKRFIVEHSFHSNYSAAKWLYDDNNLEKLAKVEGECIAEFHNLDKKNPKFIRVINDVNYRSSAKFNADNVIGQAKEGECFTVVARVKSDTSTDMYKLASGFYITTSSRYVEILK